MTIELATPDEHKETLEETVGAALIAAVSKIFEDRIKSLEIVTKVQHSRIEALLEQHELVTQAQHEKLQEFQDRFEKFEEIIDNELEKRVEAVVEEALDGLEVNCEIKTGGRSWR